MGRTTTAQCRGASTLLLYTVSIPSLRKRKGGREEGRKEGRQEEKRKRKEKGTQGKWDFYKHYARAIHKLRSILEFRILGAKAA